MRFGNYLFTILQKERKGRFWAEYLENWGKSGKSSFVDYKRNIAVLAAKLSKSEQSRDFGSQGKQNEFIAAGFSKYPGQTWNRAEFAV